MSAKMGHRGPDQSGTYRSGDVAFGHNRLAIIDVENGRQPMTRAYRGDVYTIIYNGELYNSPELLKIVRANGIEPTTRCDTELVLDLYMLFGSACAGMLNGIFAFAIHDESRREVYLARDRFGIKPLFYARVKDGIAFASEVKSLLAHPDVRPDVDRCGLWELLFLSPVRLSGGIFRGVCEIDPACHAIWRGGEELEISRYWELEAKPCTDSREEMIAKTRELLTDAIVRQLVSDVPLCTLLSGGLDSSVVSAVAADSYIRRGARLSTYSFEYEGNRESFHSSLFQPQSDDEYALYMAKFLETDHRVLTAPTDEVAALLEDSARARDFPGQADIDSSLLYFCRLIKQRHTVALSGECADEIFGGYPWFYRPEMLESDFFPFIHDPMLRASLFENAIVKSGEGYEYMCDRFRESLSACPTLDEDTVSMRESRRATWLSVNYFMTSLLERKDRMSMAASVEVRVPYADHRILEYVYNVPWEVKFENGVEKALLRNAMADWLPDRILNRKKSPYPKTQNPAYEAAVRRMLDQRLEKKGSALNAMLNREALESFLKRDAVTWFGQLMGRPQMLAWLIQFDAWCDFYNVNFTGG
jgi:asparagine synthase (glutamine-hydrolysing)